MPLALAVVQPRERPEQLRHVLGSRCRCRGRCTLTRAVSRSRRTASRTSPPLGEYLTAFCSRFSTTSAIRSPSAQAGSGSSGSSSTSGCAASEWKWVAASRIRAPRSTSLKSKANWPVSSRVVSSVRSIRLAMRVAAPTIALRPTVLPRRPRRRARSSSAQPRIEASGARKSCATTFTSSLLVRSSSTSRAFVCSSVAYSSALRSRIPIPSASVCSVITWPRSKAPGRSPST